MKSLEPGHYVALHGMPVAGKSVLAAEAVRDPEITLQVSIYIHLNATIIILSFKRIKLTSSYLTILNLSYLSSFLMASFGFVLGLLNQKKNF